MSSKNVTIQREEDLALIALDRPERHNSFDVATIRALHAAVQEAVDDDSVRAIILTGTGRAFCTGADLGEMRERAERAGALLDELTLAAHATVEAIRYAPKPVIAAVNGTAAGGGIGIALAADLIVMAASARFVVAFANLGLAPDCGSTAALTHTLGVYRAREAVLIDGGIHAEQALAWGLVNRVVAEGDLLDTARELALKAGARSRHTIEATKALVQLARHSPLETSLEAERRAMIRGASGSDFREGLQAFLEKRAPRFADTAGAR